MTVKTRLYSFAAAAWAAFYLVAYVVVVRGQGNDVAWWYVALVLAPLVLTMAAGLEGASSRAGKVLLVSLVLFVFSALLGLVSLFGLLLVPSIVATAIAAGAIGREPAAR